MAQLAINSRDAASTGISLFFLNHRYDLELLDIEGLDTGFNPEDTAWTPKERAKQIITKIYRALKIAQSELAAAQQKYKEYANTHQDTTPQYKVGDKVWLDLCNIQTDCPSKKLDTQHAKFTVLKKIRSHAYQLDTPAGIYNIFHISLLRPAANDLFPSQQNDDY